MDINAAALALQNTKLLQATRLKFSAAGVEMIRTALTRYKYGKDYLPGNYRDEETLYLVFHADDMNQIKDVNLASFNPTTEEPIFIDLSRLSKTEMQVNNLHRLLAKVKGELIQE